jgi:hypothetical protein
MMHKEVVFKKKNCWVHHNCLRDLGVFLYKVRCQSGYHMSTLWGQKKKYNNGCKYEQLE